MFMTLMFFMKNKCLGKYGTEISEKRISLRKHTIGHLSFGNARLPQMRRFFFYFFDFSFYQILF